MKKLLKKAKKEIEKEMNETGFIIDSDRVCRFLDELVDKLVDEEVEEEVSEDMLLEEIKNKIMCSYEHIIEIDESADCKSAYYLKTHEAFQGNEYKIITWKDFENIFLIGE